MVKRANPEPSESQPTYQAAYHRPFAPREPWTGPTEYGSRMSKEILAKLKSFGRRKPNRDWAKKILDRHRAGETVPMYVLECALEVSGDAPAPRVPDDDLPLEREPGED